MEKDFYPECQGAPKELGGVGGENDDARWNWRRTAGLAESHYCK